MIYENIYIHIPFCSRKCSYCSFFSVPSPHHDQIDAYLSRMEADLRDADLSLPAKTIYIGGGTPSLLSPREMSRLFQAIRENIPVTADTEISMECNPESLDEDKIDIALDFVNRLSLGIQTFHSGHRDRLGREAEDRQIELALSFAKKHDRLQLNLDLIYGVPGQTREDWRDELEMAMSHRISHMSCYCLTVENGTPLAEKLSHDEHPNDELTATMWEDTGKILGNHGLKRYEISNYCLPGSECRHNLNVWYGQPYLGLGPAATSFDGMNRWTQPQSLEAWLQQHHPETDVLDPGYRMMEIFIIGLRTANGWTQTRWEKVYLQRNQPISWESIITHGEKVRSRYRDLINVSTEHIHLTEKGLLFWNTVAEAWLE